MYKYVYEDGEYLLKDGDETLYRSDEIAIAFSKDKEGMWTLHKHGSKEHVQEWFDKITKIYRQAGHNDIADEMVMISGKFPIEEVNKCINTSGYVKIMYEKLGLEA